MRKLIDYSQADFASWQAEREAMRQENEKLHGLVCKAAEWLIYECKYDRADFLINALEAQE